MSLSGIRHAAQFCCTRSLLAKDCARAMRTRQGLGDGRMGSSRDDGADGGKRTTGNRPHTYAAIDLGSNNCRLLIARPAKAGFRVFDGFSRLVRLGEGVGASGVLSEAAMARTVEALGICARKMSQRGVTRARAIATEACRRAANRDVFLERVADETGIALDIISSREEARLALVGCLPLLDADALRALVVDIGGGSTELVWLRCDGARPHEVTAWTSLPCGVVTLAETHGGDRVPRAAYEAMVERVRALLAPFEAANGLGREIAAGSVQMLGTSGTVTTIAGVFLDLPRYSRARVDGLWLRFADIEATSARLRALDYAARAAIPSVGPRRADLVVAGCAILEAIRRAWPVDRLRVADRGLREGMLLGMMGDDQHGAGGCAVTFAVERDTRAGMSAAGSPRAP
jgi:exopolyphosphatase/guanosine-5'-triphosphate,3'-diphosphate pyrophosphatase